jgi:hypothetical protein
MPNLDPNTANSGGLLTPHQGQPGSDLDFGQLSPSLHSIGEPPPVPLQFMTNEDGLISFDEPPYKLDKHWQATEDIDKDVSSLNTGINSLIETLGLSPEYLAENNIDPSLQSHSQQDDQMFSTFLNTFPPGEDGGGGLHSGTVDGYTNDGHDSPVIPSGTAFGGTGDETSGGASRRKRKSDIAMSDMTPTTNSVPDSMTSMFDSGTGTNTRSKRRKG